MYTLASACVRRSLRGQWWQQLEAVNTVRNTVAVVNKGVIIHNSQLQLWAIDSNSRGYYIYASTDNNCNQSQLQLWLSVLVTVCSNN